MRLMISPSKNAKSFYVIQSIRRNGKNSSEIVEKLGTEKVDQHHYGRNNCLAYEVAVDMKDIIAHLQQQHR